MPNEQELEIVNLDNTHAIIEIPETCVELTLQCKVVIKGELQTVMRTMDMKEIREAMNEYGVALELGYFPPDTVFTLTEKGKDYANRLDEQEAEERAGL